MKRKNLSGIYGGLVLLVFAAVAWTARVPESWQMKRADVSDLPIRCTLTCQLLYSRGDSSGIPSSYAKLDDSGNTLMDSATTWTMVRDNVTGLIWEMKTNKDGIVNYDDPHDADNTYTWYDSNPATNGGYEGTPDKGKDTKDFINDLNSAKFGGYSDWRLPSLKELHTIVNYDVPPSGPTITAAYFPNTQPSFYWSSTASVGYDYRAWCVGFDDGYAHDYGKYGKYYVRAVRGSLKTPTPQLHYWDNSSIPFLGDGYVCEEMKIENVTMPWNLSNFGMDG